MRLPVARMLFVAVLALVCVPRGAEAQIETITQKRNVAGKTLPSEREEQEALFNYYFQGRNLKFETRLHKLKTQATVPGWRIPYSADLHSHTGGGLGSAPMSRGLFRRSSGGSTVLAHYDQAFNSGSEGRADAWEVYQLSSGRRGLFGRSRSSSEPWEGYCSGFTASTIKHPEPVRAVDAGQFGGATGVVFQPADIKALLSCIYNRTVDDSYLYLAPPSSRDGGPNMGSFHLALANYIGQAGHPVGIDRTKGEVSWNNPIYTYESEFTDEGDRDGLWYRSVSTTITYSFYGSDHQQQTDLQTGERRGNVTQSMSFRYLLAVDADGKIVGGQSYSYNGHFLWIPLYAVQGRSGNKAPGNPYIDVRKVLAMARASALPEVQKKYDAETIGPQIDPAVTAAEEKAAQEKKEKEKAAPAAKATAAAKQDSN